MSQPPQAGTGSRASVWARVESFASIAVFDIGGPLVVYQVLRSHGVSEVKSLVLSGIFPALGVALTAIRRRRLDAIGALVLLGIAVGTVVGLASGNAKLVLVEGSVPTGIFGLVCLGSLWTSRPLMFRFALEFIGPDTPKGLDFSSRWQWEGFRHTFNVITVVWGVAYLAEAAARVIIVENTSAGTALAISKFMPFAVAGIVVAWMTVYGQHAKRKGEAAGAAARAAQAAQATQVAQAAQAAATAVPAAEPPATPRWPGGVTS
ncbi:MAG TPA: VC0807 family protein [Streptosporangiaceae bacterium]|nr:VC0807 family protein [Streptosporangiaceae bacterium]